jgi:hypothetical protein
MFHMEHSLTSGTNNIKERLLGFTAWIERNEIGKVLWRALPDGTPVNLEMRTLPDGRSTIVPNPLWVEISSDRLKRNFRLIGNVKENGLPSFREIHVYAHPGNNGWDDIELDLGVAISVSDMKFWEEKVLEVVSRFSIEGEEALTLERSEEMFAADQKLARELLRDLRRMRGRPGRVKVSWSTKVDAARLRDNKVAWKDICNQFLNEYGDPYSRSQVNRWVKEVKAAESAPDE